jgi:hypothetical protein
MTNAYSRYAVHSQSEETIPSPFNQLLKTFSGNLPSIADFSKNKQKMKSDFKR